MSESPEEKSEGNPPDALVPSVGDLPSEIKRTIQQVAENPGVAVEPQKIEQALLAVITKMSMSFSYSRQGPLPPPEELAKYEEILPGAAERIIASSEKQMDHRIALEKNTVTSQNSQSGKGQLFGFIIAIVALLCAFGAILEDHAAAGTIIGTVDLVALVSVFVLGRGIQKSDLSEKAKTVPEPGKSGGK